jgi:hypothetical protein
MLACKNTARSELLETLLRTAVRTELEKGAAMLFNQAVRSREINHRETQHPSQEESDYQDAIGESEPA